jgi:hypothetical protein
MLRSLLLLPTEKCSLRRGDYRVLVRKREGKNHLEDTGVDGKIILRWIFRNWDVGAWTGSSWLRIGTGDGRL